MTSAIVKSIEVMRCGAGWRNYAFVKIIGENGVVGWSEYDDTNGPPAIAALIEALAPKVVGEDAFQHERIFNILTARTRSAPGSSVTEALGAIENALLDLKARTLGVPCHALFGGKLRDRIECYWSHFGTWEVGFPHIYKPAITSLNGLRDFAAECASKGWTRLKTNILDFSGEKPVCLQQGFGAPFKPELTITRALIRTLLTQLEAIRDGLGPDGDLMIDLNFNARTDGYLELVRALNDVDLFWIELDTFDAQSLALIRAASRHRITSCETLCTPRQFRPFFEARAMDVAVIDAVWNGNWQSLKIAQMAETYEINVAPHNFYGHLATAQNAHLMAAVPNLAIMETDPARQAIDADLFSAAPEYDGQQLIVSDAPGWGIVPNEEVIAANPPLVFGSIFAD